MKIDISGDSLNDLSANLWAGVLAALLFQVGFRVWMAIDPANWLPAIGTVVLYGLALVVLLIGVTGQANAHGKKIAWIGIFVLGVGAAVLLFTKVGSSFGTDAALFNRLSAELVVEGRNPYTANLYEQHHYASTPFPTPKIDGGVVSSLSYPAGSMLLFVPSVLLGGPPNGMITMAVVTLLAGVVLVHDSPAAVAPVALIALLAAGNMLFAGIGGILDTLWAFPLILSMRAWRRDALCRAALWLGVAGAIKQTVWFVAPFLAIWLLQRAPTVRGGLQDIRQVSIYGGIAFLVPNLPFMLDAPQAWLTGTFTPLGGHGTLNPLGRGLSVLTWTGIYPLSPQWYTLALGSTLLLGLALYALYWSEETAWVAWIAGVVLFVHWRSLNSYFITLLPIAYYAMLCQADAIDYGYGRRAIRYWREKGTVDTAQADDRSHA